jgi:hypothetical protein
MQRTPKLHTALSSCFRPRFPMLQILSVVVPTLRSDGLGWRLEGKYLARQCLIIRGAWVFSFLSRLG